MDGITELAGMLKARENKPYLGPQTGIVKAPPPNILVEMGAIVLDKDDLVIAAHVLSGYQRKLTITGTVTGNLSAPNLVVGPLCDSNLKICNGQATLSNATTNEVMTYTDDLKEGDMVILVPSTDEQRYYLMDKAVMF